MVEPETVVAPESQPQDRVDQLCSRSYSRVGLAQFRARTGCWVLNKSHLQPPERMPTISLPARLRFIFTTIRASRCTADLVRDCMPLNEGGTSSAPIPRGDRGSRLESNLDFRGRVGGAALKCVGGTHNVPARREGDVSPDSPVLPVSLRALPRIRSRMALIFDVSTGTLESPMISRRVEIPEGCLTRDVVRVCNISARFEEGRPGSGKFSPQFLVGKTLS